MYNERLRRACMAVTLWVCSSTASVAGAATQEDNSAASLALSQSLPIVQPVQACSSLKSLDMSDIGGKGSFITSATETSDKGVAVCAVEGTLAPSIGFKVVLPLHSWTQRYLQVGCGGLCGRISLEVGAAEGCTPLDTGGFVTASTDMGHQGEESFGEDPQKRQDFAFRGVHLTALAAKKLIHVFYGRSEAYSYFNGCSDGGREALMEAQRYPNDFNGIIAGAAAMNFQTQNAMYHAWQARTNTSPDGKAVLIASRLPLIHRAVLNQCDALDGQVDGLISDPRACHFDPGTLQCKSEQNADNSNCLSPAEVDVVRRLYEGPKDPATGQRLIAGGPQPGSELAWADVFVPQSHDDPIFSKMIAMGALQWLSFEQSPGKDFKLSGMQFDLKTFDRLRPLHAFYDATNPDLSAFAKAGGKLIIWHGWADPHISPINSIAYHEAVQRVMGKEQASTFKRLYLLPGVYHCGQGEGPAKLDLLTPMLSWVEGGQAPEAILTNQTDGQTVMGHFGAPTDRPMKGAPDFKKMKDAPNLMKKPVAKDEKVIRSRLVYPYPYVAAYDGKGDPANAESYKPGKPLFNEETRPWAGSDFYSPYTFRMQ